MMIIEVTAGIEMIVGEIDAIETMTIGVTAAIEIATEMILDDPTAIGITMADGIFGIIVETIGPGAISGGLFDI